MKRGTCTAGFGDPGFTTGTDYTPHFRACPADERRDQVSESLPVVPPSHGFGAVRRQEVVGGAARAGVSESRVRSHGTFYRSELICESCERHHTLLGVTIASWPDLPGYDDVRHSSLPVVEGAGSREAIEGRVKRLRAQIEEAPPTTTGRRGRSPTDDPSAPPEGRLHPVSRPARRGLGTAAPGD